VMTFLLANGCANPFSKDLLAKVENNVSYREFQDDPEKNDCNLLMFGWEIIETKNRENGAWIIVLQKPLNEEGQTNWALESCGRFLVATSSFLDVEAFRRGRSITVIGEVDNSKGLPICGNEYWYPFPCSKATVPLVVRQRTERSRDVAVVGLPAYFSPVNMKAMDEGRTTRSS